MLKVNKKIIIFLIVSFFILVFFLCFFEKKVILTNDDIIADFKSNENLTKFSDIEIKNLNYRGEKYIIANAYYSNDSNFLRIYKKQKSNEGYECKSEQYKAYPQSYLFIDSESKVSILVYFLENEDIDFINIKYSSHQEKIFTTPSENMYISICKQDENIIDIFNNEDFSIYNQFIKITF